jgi:hypothetical protein
MGVTERGGGPAVASGTGAVSVTLTGGQQPQTDDWLVIRHGNDFYTLANMTAPTVGGSTSGVVEVTGTGLPADGGTNFAHVRVWKKKITSGGSDLVVALVETGSADEDKMIAVSVCVGADPTDCIDVAAGAFDSTNVPTTQRIAPSISPSTAAYLLCHTNDGGGSSSAPYTPPSGMAEQYDGTTGGMGYSGAVLQLAAPGATGTEIFTVANTAAAYAAVSIAIKADSTPALGQTSTNRHPGAAPGGGRFYRTPRSTEITTSQAASGSGAPTAHTSTASTGVHGAAGAAAPTARTATSSTEIKKAAGAAAPTARTSTVDSGTKAGQGVAAPTARTSTAESGVKKATGAAAPMTRTSTAAAGQHRAAAAQLPTARTATASSGRHAGAGAGRPSARTAVTSSGGPVSAVDPSARWTVEQGTDIWSITAGPPWADIGADERMWRIAQG